MKKTLKTNKGFISITLVIGILIGTAVLGFGGYKIVNQIQASNLIKQAEGLGTAENYEDAANLLEKAQAKVFIKSSKEKISEDLEKYKQLSQDKSYYNQALEKFNNNDWQGAIDIFFKVSSISPLYQDSQDKINKSNEEIEKIREAEQKAAEEKKSKQEAVAYKARLQKEEVTNKKIAEEDNSIKIEKCKSEYILNKEKRIQEFENGEFVAFKRTIAEIENIVYNECVNSMMKEESFNPSSVSDGTFTEIMSTISTVCDQSAKTKQAIDDTYNKKLSEIEQQLQQEYQQCLSQ